VHRTWLILTKNKNKMYVTFCLKNVKMPDLPFLAPKSKMKFSRSQLRRLVFFVKMGNNAPVIAGKSLATIESGETL